MNKKQNKLKYTKPKIQKQDLTINNFFDNRYIDSLPSLFGSVELLTASGPCSPKSTGCACLLPQTNITLYNKTNIPIEKVTKGTVLFDGTPEGATVTACYPHLRHDGYIDINKGAIKSSLDHKFWLEDKQIWEEAKNIKTGNFLLNLQGDIIKIESIEKFNRSQLVYNIELDFNKNVYYANGIKTHMSKILPSINSTFWENHNSVKNNYI